MKSRDWPTLPVTSSNTPDTPDTPDAPARLVAVVVTFNRLEHLKLTLARLLETSEADLTKVLVVDNASSDGTGDWLAAQDDPRLVVHRSEINTGGAGGFETGMRQAVERFDPDWLVVMDDDARPEVDALARFHAGDRTAHDAWAAAVRHPDGRICDINRPSVNPFWNRAAFIRTALGNGREGFHLSEKDYQGTAQRAVDAASFVGLFVSRAAIKRVGFPDGRLFVYGDDVLYTLRLRAAGGRIAFDPGLRFEHDFSTIAVGQIRFHPLWKCYYHHRNLLIVYREAAGLLFWPALLIILPKWISKLRHYSGERWIFLKLLSLAVRDGLIRRTGVDHDAILAFSDSGYRGDSAPKE